MASADPEWYGDDAAAGGFQGPTFDDPPPPPAAGGFQGPTFDGRRFVADEERRGGRRVEVEIADRRVDLEIVAPAAPREIEIAAVSRSRSLTAEALERADPEDAAPAAHPEEAEEPEAPEEPEEPEAPEAPEEPEAPESAPPPPPDGAAAKAPPETPAPRPRDAAARAVAAIASELQCSICCSTAAACCAAVPCGHVFCRACLAPWLRRKRSCPNCNAPVDARVPFVEIRALDNVVSALVEASPQLAARDSVDRRRARVADVDVSDGPPEAAPGGFVTAAELLRRRAGEPATTRRETSRFLASATPVTARPPRRRGGRRPPPVDGSSPIMRSVAGLETPSDISRAVDSLRDLDLPGSRGSPAPSATRPPRAPANTPARSSPSPAATPASTPRRRLSLVDRQRLAAERGAERRAAASPASSDGARWRA